MAGYTSRWFTGS